MTVRYTGAAERDFVEIGAHIARDDIAIAIRFQAELEKFIGEIAQNPLIYRERQEWGEGLRAARLKSFLVIFEIEEDGLLILRIVSGRRNIAKLLRESTR